MKMPTDNTSINTDHWPDMARHWKQVGEPLRPSQEDLGFVMDEVARWRADHAASPRVLLLGVTPEIWFLPWPEGTVVLAADRSRLMVETVWPGPQENVVRTDWRELTLEAASRDIALCDGGLHLLPHPHGQMQLARKLRDILPAGGLCILRLFIPPRHRESSAEVLSDLLKGQVPNLNVLKLRLAMSLQETPDQGVETGHVWNVLNDFAPDLDELAARLGWTVDHIRAIHAYRNCSARYSFATAEQACGMFCNDPGGFTLRGLKTPSYTLGERCPTLVLERKG